MQHSLQVTISALPDDVLLEIFKFYVDSDFLRNTWFILRKDTWHTLVHVCQKWRYVVFASPRWLCLELHCTNRILVKKMLDIWPALPIVIKAYMAKRRSGVANIIAALKRHDLVCRIDIGGVPNLLFKSPAMKRRFPELTDLALRSKEENAPVITDSFLGGSAPRLRSLQFRGIPFPFPALGKLLLSTTHLVSFCLLDIPNSGIISPEQIVTSLSALTKLKELSMGFRSPRSRADRERRHSTLLKRLVLPSLTEFYFKGDSEYLEDIVDRMDTPALRQFTITFFNQLVFDTPLLHDFFSRTAVFQQCHGAEVLFTRDSVKLSLFQDRATDRRVLAVWVSSRVPEWQLSSLAQFCSTSLPHLPTLERLSILNGSNVLAREWKDDMERSQWLELLRPFVSVRELFLGLYFVRGALLKVALALRDLTGNTVTEVLPALQQLFSKHDYLPDSDRIGEALAQFITARQLSGHPVAFHPTTAAWSKSSQWLASPH